MIVVKVGGSLFDHPRLGPGLRAYLDSLASVADYRPTLLLCASGYGRRGFAIRTFAVGG